MPESNERMVRVETIVERNEEAIARLAKETAEMKAHASASLSDVKESLIQLRFMSENMMKSQELHASRIDSTESRVQHLEQGLNQVKTEIEKVDSGWKSEKSRMMAWGSGIMLVVSGIWAVIGSSVKSFITG